MIRYIRALDAGISPEQLEVPARLDQTSAVLDGSFQACTDISARSTGGP